MKHFIAYTKILWRNEVKATSLCNVYIFKIILYFLISKLVFPSTPCVLLKLIYDTRVRKKEDIAELKFSLEKREKKILSLKVEVRDDTLKIEGRSKGKQVVRCLCSDLPFLAWNLRELKIA